MTRNARRTRWAKPVAGVALIGVLSALPALAGCAGVETANAADATLERFTSCAALTEFAQSKAREMVGPYGLGGGPFITQGGLARAERLQSATAPTAAGGANDAASAKVAGQDFSTTNVQEAGVDEPDIVKSDGTRIFAIARNRLYAIDASGPTPRIVGSLELPKDTFARYMMLSGDRILLMGDGPVNVRPLPAPAQTQAKRDAGSQLSIDPAYGAAGSVLIQIDVTDSAAMRVLETLQAEARYVSARLTGTTARVVVAAGGPMGITFTSPAEPGPATEDEALRTNRAALARTTADNWLPRFSVTSAAGTSAPQPIVGCDAVSRPPVFSGLDTLTVLTVDLNGGLDPIDTDAVMASGENLYASPQGLYVATNRWAFPDAQGNVAEVNTTQIHKFDTTGSSQTTYRGSGTVIGHTLNQFSMSEHEGSLRIATTEASQNVVGSDAVVDNGGGGSESYVTVLDERDGKLVQLGQVGGLGKGERIYAVRFIGTTGYVVTFKQTDPLYTVDLTDPAAPRVAGELKIAGYSAYLHPIGDNLLIGVGQDATEQGRTKGLQVSLFDVSDPASPKRIQNAVLPGANSDAEWDHHAFLWWPAKSLAVIPFQRSFAVTGIPSATGDVAVGAPEQVSFEAGALGLRVTRDGIGEAGRVTHPNDPQFGPGVRRSLVVGDTLLTLSDGGLKASGLDDLTERAWIPFT